MQQRKISLKRKLELSETVWNISRWSTRSTNQIVSSVFASIFEPYKNNQSVIAKYSWNPRDLTLHTHLTLSVFKKFQFLNALIPNWIVDKNLKVWCWCNLIYLENNWQSSITSWFYIKANWFLFHIKFILLGITDYEKEFWKSTNFINS